MILVDTSVWIDHLRRSNAVLVRFLGDARVMVHPMIIGELALGNLADRTLLLSLLHGLPPVTGATHHEVLAMVERDHLFGLGLGLVDAFLLASVRLTPGTTLWTRDRRLAATAARFGLTPPASP